MKSINGKSQIKIILLLIFVGVIFVLCTVIHLKNTRDKTALMSSGGSNSNLLKLGSIGYVAWVPTTPEDSDKSGVTEFNSKLASAGVTLYCSEDEQSAHLLDMMGNTLHSFTDKRFFRKKQNWHYVRTYQDDEFLVLIYLREILRIGWDSKIKKRYNVPAHHDIAVAEDGTFYTLMNEIIDLPELSENAPVRNDLLVSIREDGEIVKKASFVKMIIQNKDLLDLVRNRETMYDVGGSWDVFRTNSIEIINRDIFAGNHKLFKKGNVLCCVRNQDIIVVIDVEKEEFVWHWQLEEGSLPHHASLLENGNILLFDNGVNRRSSKVLELNPATKEIEWEYQGDPPESFYTETRGSAQRLPNGNTLITESGKGRVFEITKDGKIVWEFYNPAVKEFVNKKTGEKRKKRATIYRAFRITNLKKYPKLYVK